MLYSDLFNSYSLAPCSLLTLHLILSSSIVNNPLIRLCFLLSLYVPFLSVHLSAILLSVFLLNHAVVCFSIRHIIGIFDEFERTRSLYHSDLEAARLASKNRLKKRTLRNVDSNALTDTEEKSSGEIECYIICTQHNSIIIN